MARSLFVAAACLIGCSSTGCSSTESPADFDHGATQTVIGTAESHLAYPPAPYGTRPGGVIENFQFLGWHRPDLSKDPTKLEPVSLAEYYNPDGTKPTRFIVMTATAVWCSACKLEYRDLTSKQITDFRSRGVEFIGALFQDQTSNPAQPSDLHTWASTYAVSFPFVLDPELKLGVFFSLEATPMEMVIDTKTMQILTITDGWLPGNDPLWTYLDKLLGD